MEISTLTKGPERVFIVVKNNDGSSITIGRPCEWQQADGTNDGVEVQMSQTAAAVSLIAGAAHQSAADQKYFRIQCYGYDTDTHCYAHGPTATNDVIALGDIGVALSVSVVSFITVGAEAVEIDANPGQFIAMSTRASTDPSTTQVAFPTFIRCM